MVLAIRYDTTTQDALSIWPRLEAIAGSAVATMVWSATARNIGSMIGGKTLRNCDPAETTGAAAASVGAAGVEDGAASERSAPAGWFKDSFIARIQIRHE